MILEVHEIEHKHVVGANHHFSECLLIVTRRHVPRRDRIGHERADRVVKLTRVRRRAARGVDPMHDRVHPLALRRALCRQRGGNGREEEFDALGRRAPTLAGRLSHRDSSP